MTQETRTPIAFWCLALALAFCSFSYQLVIANAIVLFHGGQVMWHCITIGIYLSAVGFGTVAAGRRQGVAPWALLVRMETLLAGLGGCSMLLLIAAHMLYRIFYIDGVLLGAGGTWLGELPYVGFVLAGQCLVVLIGFLTGFEIPLLIQWSGSRAVTGVLACNYLGALVATVFYAFVLFPNFELSVIAAMIALVNLAICVSMQLASREGKGGTVTIAVAVTAVTLALLSAGWVTGMDRKIFFYYQDGLLDEPIPFSRLGQTMAKEPDVSHYRSLYQHIDISYPQWPHAPHVLTLHLNNHFQFSTRMERFYHEGMAHVPISRMQKIPKNVLVLGAGDGLLIRELLRYGDAIETITLVELDPAMVTLGKTHQEIKELNEGALFNPKLKIVYDDAFFYLRAKPGTYDAVFVDFPYPYNYDLSKLYSVEFYTFVKQSLAPGGYGIINGPLYTPKSGQTITDKQFTINSILYSTLEAAGFGTVSGFKAHYESFLIVVPEKIEMARPDLNPGGLKFVALDAPLFEMILGQEFPHEVRAKHVNSVFKPTMTKLTDPFL